MLNTAGSKQPPPQVTSRSVEKTFNPYKCVVDIKGNRYSENLASDVENIEELEQIASAQRRLMREAATIATNMQINYIQVQTLLASKIAENHESKTPTDLLDLQTDVATSPALGGDGEKPSADDDQHNETVRGSGKQPARTCMSAVDLESSDVEETGRGESPHNKRPRSGSPPASVENRLPSPSPRREEKGGKPADAKGVGENQQRGKE